MKRPIVVIGLLAALPGFAQHHADPTPEQLRALVNVIRQQRDQAVQAYQDTQAQLQLVNAELAELKKMLAAKSATESLSN